MKRYPHLPAVQSALDYVRRGLKLDKRTFFEKREDEEIARNFDVDAALKKAIKDRLKHTKN